MSKSETNKGWWGSLSLIHVTLIMVECCGTGSVEEAILKLKLMYGCDESPSQQQQQQQKKTTGFESLLTSVTELWGGPASSSLFMFLYSLHVYKLLSLSGLAKLHDCFPNVQRAPPYCPMGSSWFLDYLVPKQRYFYEDARYCQFPTRPTDVGELLYIELEQNTPY